MRTSLPLFLLLAAVPSAPALAQCPGLATVTVYSSDFETDDGGLVPSAGGDWEYGVIPVVMDSSECEYWHESPGGAHSGTHGWGTVLDNCHHNLGANSTLTLTVDLSDPSYQSAKLKFAQWYEVFVEFDYVHVAVNGNDAYMNDEIEYSGGWLEQEVDLSSHLGDPSVEIGFQLYASAVVALAGWYIDDVQVTACSGSTIGIAESGASSFSLWPVPASDVLNVHADALAGGVSTWTMYDASGRAVMQGNARMQDRFTIDVEGLHGVYVLELQGAKGISRQRVVVE